VVSIGYALQPRDMNSSQGLHLTQLTPFDYALTQLGVIARYLRLVVWPSGLSFDYFDWPVARSLGDVMPGALVTFAALGATAVLLARRPALGLVGAWFFVLLAPTSTVLPLAGELVAERRLYLALAAPALVAALALQHLRERAPRLANGAGALTVALLALATARHNLAYRTAVGIFSDAVAARPPNVRARYNYGNALKDEGRIDLALAEYRGCMARDVGYMDAYTNAVVAGQRLGLRNPWEGHETGTVADVERAEAEAAPFFNRSERAMQQGQRDAAVGLLREATRLAPTSMEAHARLAYVLLLDPNPAARQGAEGLRAALRAWALSGSVFDPMTGTMVAAAYAELGRFDDALRVTAQLMAFLERAGVAPLVAEHVRLRARYRRHERWAPP
jgi:tetratricopeptide (TPR) repeat protein